LDGDILFTVTPRLFRATSWDGILCPRISLNFIEWPSVHNFGSLYKKACPLESLSSYKEMRALRIRFLKFGSLCNFVGASCSFLYHALPLFTLTVCARRVNPSSYLCIPQGYSLSLHCFPSKSDVPTLKSSEHADVVCMSFGETRCPVQQFAFFRFGIANALKGTSSSDVAATRLTTVSPYMKGL
jgi:hypothetical protein